MIKEIPAWLVLLLIGAAAFFLAPYIPYVNAVMLGLLLGLLAGNTLPAGISSSTAVNTLAGKGLEWAILFLSFSINYENLLKLGWLALVLLVLVIGLSLWLSVLLAKKMKYSGQAGLLIGFGTAICGSAAIAALSPQIHAKKEDTATAMAVVNLLGITFMLSLPLVLPFLIDDAGKQGYFLGATLHAAGNVAGAGYAISPEVGEAAISIKLARIALLTPALFFMHFLTSKTESSQEKPAFKMPWYLWGFLLITLLNSFIKIPAEYQKMLVNFGDLLLTLAMVAIGMRIRIKSLISSGKKGLVFGLLIFGIQSALFLLTLFAI